MKMIEKIKKLIRESNPMNKHETLIEKCLKGKCSNIKEQLEFTLFNFPFENDLKNELGLDKDEFEIFVEAEDPYDTFKEILITRAISKN